MKHKKETVLETVKRINHEVSTMTNAKQIKKYLKECQTKLENK